jgi:structural maintenance of chromosome 2
MKIEELIIDGFKSYAVRTTIDKWDPTFNAITVNSHKQNSWSSFG